MFLTSYLTKPLFLRYKLRGNMTVNRLSDKVAGLAMERVAALLADRVADRVVEALMKAGFDKQFADSLLRALREEAERSQ